MAFRHDKRVSDERDIRNLAIVGFMGTIFSMRTIENKEHIYCNIHTWIVDKSFRINSFLLLTKLMKKNIILTAFTPIKTLVGLFEKFGFEKVYEQGFNIKTPLNLNLQNIATYSLRKGLIEYDQRRGWRGPITNVLNFSNWTKDLKKYELEKSINWNIAIVKKIDKFSTNIEINNGKKGVIKFNEISWTKKEFKDLFKVGDIIYVKRVSENNYELKQIPKINGGIVVMDPYTGRVLAMSGGFSFKKSEFNRSTQALRQPGSAFKPFIYALALENNFTPSTLILDAPIVLDQGEDLKMWKPENYGKKFYGPSTLRTGLEKSRNLMTVRIAQELGLNKITNFSKKLNIYDNPEELMSISLGSAETTLLNLTAAYCSFVNGGKLIEPIFVDRIQDSEGKTIYNSEKILCKNCIEISYLGTVKMIGV